MTEEFYIVTKILFQMLFLNFLCIKEWKNEEKNIRPETFDLYCNYPKVVYLSFSHSTKHI